MQVGGSSTRVGDATLTAVLEELQDVLLELTSKVDEGGTIHLAPEDIASLQVVTATVLGMPSDYPDTGTNAKLNDVKTLINTTNSALADLLIQAEDSNTALFALHGSNSITDLYAKLETMRVLLAALPTTAPQTNALTDTQLRASAVSVTDTRTDYPSTAANTRLDTLHTDLSHLTDSTQLTKLTDGSNTAAVIAGDANGISVNNLTKTLTQTFSGIAAGASIDTLGYSWIEVVNTAATTTFTATPQQSNDSGFANSRNAVYWPNSGSANQNLSAGSQAFTSTIISLIVPVIERYFRLNVTAYSSTPNIVVTYILHSGPIPEPPTKTISGAVTISSGSVTAVQGSGTATQNGWAVGGGPPATSNNAATSTTTGSNITYLNAEAYWGMQIIVGGTGSLVALGITLEGSLDGGTTWTTIATTTGTTSGTYGSNSVPMPFTIVRSRITTFTVASGSPTVTTKIAGSI